MAVGAAASAAEDGAAPEAGRPSAVFAEDVVCHAAAPGQLGLVARVFGESDSEDDDDFSDASSAGNLQDGEALVCWLGRQEEDIEQSGDLVVLDRAFLHGDVVARASNPLGQTGSVTGVHLRVDLDPPQGAQRRVNVDPATLVHVRPFRTGHYVVQNNWLGRVGEVTDHVTVQFDDGSKCKVTNATTDRLFARAGEVLTDEAHCPYFPGQAVKAAIAHVFRHAKWLVGSWNRRMEATVVRVEPGDIEVRWLAPGPGATAGLPPSAFDPAAATELGFFSHTCWQLGDVAILPQPPQQPPAPEEEAGPAEEEEPPEPAGTSSAAAPAAAPAAPAAAVAAVAAPAAASAAAAPPPRPGASTRPNSRGARGTKARARGNPKPPKHPMDPIDPTAVVCLTRTFVDVLWQDRTTSTHVEARQLVPVTHLGDHDFWPDEYVVHRGRQAFDDEDDGGEEDRTKGRIGLVRRIDAGDRVARVRWYDRNVRDTAPFSPEESVAGEETASVYELAEHPDFAFRLGDVVLRLGGGEEAGGSLGWVGEVTGMVDGWIYVHWADGASGRVSPTDVYVIHREEEGGDLMGGDGMSSMDEYTDVEEDDDDDDRSSWETLDDGMVELDDGMASLDGDAGDAEEGDEEEEGAREAGAERDHHGYDLQAPTIARAVDMLGRLLTHADTREEGAEEAAEEAEEEAEEAEAEAAEEEGAADAPPHPSQPSASVAPSAASTAAYAAYPFARFDSAADLSDHRFAEGPNAAAPSRAVHKRIRQEYARLSTGLPDTIWVRCSEAAQRQLRVAMVGPGQTPYADGLFLFDVSLADDFPAAPPLVAYHSFGVRVNPNLYECGKVCLSLLGTWSGRTSEQWQESSTVLQVLVSILGLVLVEKPYYNEAGYERHQGSAEGEQNAKVYNESAFLLSCQTYMHLLRRPPAGFDGLIKWHFKARGGAILRACDAYLKGRQVGTLSDAEADGTEAVREPAEGEFSTQGFRLLLGKMRGRLEKAFGGLG